MRLLAALIYIIFGMWAFSKIGIDSSTWMWIPAFFFLIFTSVIFNEGTIRRFRGISYEDHVKNLLADGKAKVEEYTVQNAIVFEDMDTGCTAYLLDIGGSRMFVLYGQDYGFEPINDDPEINQERLFPTESFSITRESKNRRVLDATPKGKVINSSIIESPRIENLADFGFTLEDGEIVENIAFDDVLKALAK